MTETKQWQLRAAFAQRLSTMYALEVPAYRTLVNVARDVNEHVVHESGPAAQRFGAIGRVTAERHGAIRVGSPRELREVARIFAAMGMHAVGFYDLRDTTPAIPVVSTAFRPVDAGELALSPFRVFTSMLTPADRRFFDPELRQRLERFLSSRRLFPPELLELADRAASHRSLDHRDAGRFLRLAVDSFALSREPVDREWYQTLEKVSEVAADIGGVRSTHINHLTPRVLDIDELYRRMSDRGIAMIDTIQGPPRWSGPDVLLRQTSFRAIAERRPMREADGKITTASLRVRFGEVEARGVALTRAGRTIYDGVLAKIDASLRIAPYDLRENVTRALWEQNFPATEEELSSQRYAYFTYHTQHPQPAGLHPPATLSELVEQGWVRIEPIVYEDFLPRSAAAIFQSNLDLSDTKDPEQPGVRYDGEWLSDAIGRQVLDPHACYERQRDESIAQVAASLGIRLDLTEVFRPGM